MSDSCETLRVATLNVWNKTGPYADRLPLIRRQMSELGPDVIGFQEVLRMDGGDLSAANDQAREIMGSGWHIAYGAAMKFGNGLLFGNAIASRYPLLDERVISLPGQESGEARSCVYALCDTPYGHLPFFSTHLNWKLHHGNVRVRQVQALAEAVFDIAPPDDSRLPAVLVGDFNAGPESDEMRFLRGHHALDDHSVYFADAWEFGGDGGPGYTFDRRNRFAALAHEIPRRIDYILTLGPDRHFRGEPLHTELAFSQSGQAAGAQVWPSDHFGVMSDLAATRRDA